MASTYSTLKVQLMATGENLSTWGTVTNTNLGTALEEAIVGSADVAFSSGTVTLSLSNTNATQTARNLRLNLTGTSGGAQNLIVPAIEKVYIVNNGCADAITVKNASGTGIAVPAGKTTYLYNNGTNVVDAITHLTSLTLASPLSAASGGMGLTSYNSGGAVYATSTSALTTGTLPVASGGTGATSLTANSVVLGNGTSAVQVVTPGTSGNALISNGTTWTSAFAPPGAPDVIIQNQQPSGTAGANLINYATWTAYVLNTVVRNNGSVASLASNRVTLTAGTWLIHATVAICGTVVSTDASARVRLYNYTGSAALGQGVNVAFTGGYNAGGQTTGANPEVVAVVTLLGSTAIELQLAYASGNICAAGKAVSTGDVEVYASFEATRVG
ncbi:hypothetical protein UFOVP1288_41 [uncultured Caudovirales phage]|uniref:Uncharacterized protein n=1 Tax=uncultured Caudovirales phage TaxID=2100421 RepID=A0A6J5RNG6_9CAUD|nr:hypothetical protein UFOVP1195_41 [uncultured Caudovirales phage]CAB4195817.1 hypothetical protein UFOVP1288_41 [uncultured Caudovirales phage]CAB4205026.1 hypothetical protein UFOVP1409_41 [uncultured Caudovirales phage]